MTKIPSTKLLKTLVKESDKHSNSHCCSKCHKNGLVSTAPNGKPIATSSICFYKCCSKMKNISYSDKDISCSM